MWGFKKLVLQGLRTITKTTDFFKKNDATEDFNINLRKTFSLTKSKCFGQFLKNWEKKQIPSHPLRGASGWCATAFGANLLSDAETPRRAHSTSCLLSRPRAFEACRPRFLYTTQNTTRFRFLIYGNQLSISCSKINPTRWKFGQKHLKYAWRFGN